jgi:hypothetical protein
VGMECLGLSHAEKANLTGRGYPTFIERNEQGCGGIRGEVGSVPRTATGLV